MSDKLPSLFRQTNELAYTLSQIAEAEGELTPELDAQLTLTQQNLAGRAAWLLDLLAQAKGNLHVVKEKKAQLADYEKANQRIIDQLEGRLQGAAELFGPFSAGTYKVSLRKSEETIVTDETIIPDECRRPIIIPLQGAPDKVLIKARLKAGHEVPGAYLQPKQNLAIK